MSVPLIRPTDFLKKSKDEQKGYMMDWGNQVVEAEKAKRAQVDPVSKLDGEAARQRKELADQIAKYRRDIPSMVDQQVGLERMAMRPDVEAQKKQALMGANSRGLLYSPLAQKRQMDVEAQALGRLQERRGQLNQESLNFADQMEQVPIQSGMDRLASVQRDNLRNYQEELDNTNQRRQKTNQLVQGIGGIGGALLGAGLK